MKSPGEIAGLRCLTKWQMCVCVCSAGTLLWQRPRREGSGGSVAGTRGTWRERASVPLRGAGEHKEVRLHTCTVVALSSCTLSPNAPPPHCGAEWRTSMESFHNSDFPMEAQKRLPSAVVAPCQEQPTHGSAS